MPFKKIESKKKSTYVAEQIIDAIKAGEYVGGDKLPSEREITQLMRVSRNSVREALSALQIIGVVESQAGEGTYVSTKNSIESRIRINEKQLLTLVEEGADLLEIWKAREGIETCLASLAISRASSKGKEKVELILDGMQKATNSKNYEVYLNKNLDFHLAIADLANNPPLRKALGSLLKVAQQILKFLGDIERGYVEEHIERSYTIHEDIFKAIQSCDKSAIDKAMKLHFKELIDYLKKEFIYIF